MRTVAKDENDLRPALTVWIPTALAAYLIVFKLAEWILNLNGYDHRMPVEICGGGSCDTVQMVASGYYAGFFGIAAMVLVLGAWVARSIIAGADVYHCGEELIGRD